MAVGTLAYLWLNRDTEVEGTDLLLPTVALPSILGALLAFGVIIGPAYALAMEREDGTLLRHKAVPHGMRGYVTGQLLYHSLGLVPLLLVILVPSFLLFDDVMSNGRRRLGDRRVGRSSSACWPRSRSGWSSARWSRASRRSAPGGCSRCWSSPRSPGIFSPIQALWGWVQVVAQVFPIYWIGLGMRSAFLPDAAAARRARRLLAHRMTVAGPRRPGRSSACWSPPGCCAGWPAGSPGSQVQEAREAAPAVGRR